MKSEKIVKQAIEKAVKNGFTFQQIDGGLSKITEFEVVDEHNVKVADMFFSIVEIIFSHAFAKAFWGIELIDTGLWEKDYHQINDRFSVMPYMLYAWQYHLYQLALREDRIKYLEKYL